MAIENLLSLLNSITFINPSLDAAIRERFTIRQFKKGQIIAISGERVNEIWYLNRGLAKEYYIQPSGKAVITAFWREKEIVLIAGSFLLKTDSDRYIQLIEDCTMLAINHEQVQQLIKQFPELNLIGYAIFTELVRKTEERNVLLGLKGKEGYGRFCEIFPYSRISIADAASYLGLSRAGLSKLRSRM